MGNIVCMPICDNIVPPYGTTNFIHHTRDTVCPTKTTFIAVVIHAVTFMTPKWIPRPLTNEYESLTVDMQHVYQFKVYLCTIINARLKWLRTFLPRQLTATSQIQNYTYRKIIKYQTPQSNLPFQYNDTSQLGNIHFKRKHENIGFMLLMTCLLTEQDLLISFLDTMSISECRVCEVCIKNFCLVWHIVPSLSERSDVSSPSV